jgi:hypothetical protein
VLLPTSSLRANSARVAPSARRRRASSCCASVNFGFRPMRCPRFCARLLPSAVRVRIRSRSTLKHLAPGDVVTVTRIDPLARSTFDLFAIVKQIVDAKAQFRSLAEPWADTGTSTKAMSQFDPQRTFVGTDSNACPCPIPAISNVRGFDSKRWN